jgi:hypothetical protein
MYWFSPKSLLKRAPSSPKGRSAEVGWLLDIEKSGFLWEAPRRLSRDDPPPAHAKSVNFCPAMLDHEARMFEVPCPIDIRLGFQFGQRGEPLLVNLDGPMSAVRMQSLSHLAVIINREEWRHPERPIVQIMTPYVFVADEPVYMSLFPPVSHYQPNPWPGVLIGGRLPIHIWPRQMMWAFEWFDRSKPLVLKRGEPWFYVRFETEDPSRPVRLLEAEKTPELREYMDGLHGVANYANRTFSLFKTAASRRPSRLLAPKARSSAQAAE